MCSEDTTIDDDIPETEMSYHDGGIQYRTKKSCLKLGYDDSNVKLKEDFFSNRRNSYRQRRQHIHFRQATDYCQKKNENMFGYIPSNSLHLKSLEMVFDSV